MFTLTTQTLDLHRYATAQTKYSNPDCPPVSAVSARVCTDTSHYNMFIDKVSNEFCSVCQVTCLPHTVPLDVNRPLVLYFSRQIGKADLWDEKIYPGMRECLIGSMLASQDAMDRRQNSFELYGADFMLTDDFTPWLIEINSSPDLAHTTSVTARLCPQCLEDIIKGSCQKFLI